MTKGRGSSRKPREKRPRRVRTSAKRRAEWRIFEQDVRYNLRSTSFQNKAAAFGKLLILGFIMIGIPVLLIYLAVFTVIATVFIYKKKNL